MGQLTYAIDPVIGQPGQKSDLQAARIVTGLASVQLQAGTLVTRDPTTGLLEPVSGTTALASAPYGVVMYNPIQMEQGEFTGDALLGEYRPGDAVPVLRSGRIFVAWSGGTQGYLSSVNVHAPSTGFTTSSGVFTNTATSTTAGSEIFAVGQCVEVSPTGLTTLALIDINLP